MNILQRQLLWGILFSLIVSLLLLVSFFATFPLHDWRAIWDQTVLDIPFLLFIPSLSVVLGLIFGIVTGIYERKQLQLVEKLFIQIEESKHVEDTEIFPLVELEDIRQRGIKIQKQQLEQVRHSQKLAKEMAEDQESRTQEIIYKERNRLARELHDSVSQQLFAASMLLSAINEGKPLSDDWETKQLKMIEETIQQSQLEMRALLLHLRPIGLKGKTLKAGLEELLMELSQKVSMKIKWKAEDFLLDKGVEDHLFRILQESVSNTLRHSKATVLDVLLIKREDFVVLRIVDDGIGFDVEESKAGSYGLNNMYERAIEIGGTLKIVSLKNKGTRLEVKVPVIK
ncbi:sensor histidine kinase [Bacillaceae bacterium Marseille-Q3522]|nr:sensor histidine kinase [Bacillaceae bacterium Marseille-Q3522]